MAFPTVVINNSTGSDTAASGAGPGTALTGVLGATNTNTTVNITDAVDLSGVATDGSAMLWLKSASGLQFSQITAISGTSGAWVVTVATAYTATATGKTWAIGGKRATLDHADTRHLGLDVKAGWTIDIQQTGTNYTLTSVFSWTVTSSTVTPLKQVLVYSSSVTRPIITTATNSINLFGTSASCDPITFKHLSFSNTAGTKGSYAAGTGMGITAVGASHGMAVIDCIFDGFVSAIMGDNAVNFIYIQLQVVGCEIKNCTDRAIGLRGASNESHEFDHCWIHGNTGDGIRFTNTGGAAISLKHCIFSSNGGRGVYWSSGGASANAEGIIISNCVFKGNTNAGIENASNQLTFLCTDSIFVSNGDYGIKFSSAYSTDNSGYLPPTIYNNAFYNNTNGTVDFANEIGSITLTGDPFNSSTDFGLNATAGAGAACKGVALTAPNASANTAGDIGAIPSGGGAAAATGGPVAGNMRGGYING